MVRYNIISTGSDGNATILEDFVLIDCGVPYKALEPYVSKLKLVLLTHIHSDHFKKQTIKRLAAERPTLRFGCCRWLVPPLLAAGVPERQIDVLEPRTMYGYGLCNVIPFMLMHNVPNCGYKVHFPTGKAIYATDTNNMNGVQALGYDLYLIEANYKDEEIKTKIEEKKAAGQYAYELQVLKNHLSEAKCNDFLARNMQANSVYVPMHVHVGLNAIALCRQHHEEAHRREKALFADYHIYGIKLDRHLCKVLNLRSGEQSSEKR